MPKDTQLVKTTDLDNRLTLMSTALVEAQSKAVKDSDMAKRIQELLDLHQSYLSDIPKLQQEEDYLIEQLKSAENEIAKYEKAPDNETKEAKKDREKNKATAAKNLKEREKWQRKKNAHKEKLKEEINKLISEIIKIRQELELAPFQELEEAIAETIPSETEQHSLIATWRQTFKTRGRSVSTTPTSTAEVNPASINEKQQGEEPTAQQPVSKPTLMERFTVWRSSTSASSAASAVTPEPAIQAEEKTTSQIEEELLQRTAELNRKAHHIEEAESALQERINAEEKILESKRTTLEKERTALTAQKNASAAEKAVLDARENSLKAREEKLSLLERQKELEQQKMLSVNTELERLKAQLNPKPTLENSIKTIINEFTQAIEAKGSTASKKLRKLYCEIKAPAFAQRPPLDKLAFLENWFNKHKPEKKIGFLSWLFRFIGRPCRKPENKLMFIQMKRALVQAREQADRENPPITLARDSSTDSIVSIPSGADATPLSEEDKKLKQAIDATIHCIHDWFNSFYFIRLDAPPFIGMLEHVVSGSTKKGRKENWAGKSLQQQAEFLLQAQDSKKDQRFFKHSYTHAIHNLALKDQFAAKQEELRRFLPLART